MRETIIPDPKTSFFVEEIKQSSQQNILACNGCGKCTAGCRFARFMDFPPHQMMRAVQLGLSEELLASSAIWLCANCYVCEARCPRNLSVSRVAEALRHKAVKEKIMPHHQEMKKAHNNFIQVITSLGRLNEPILMFRRNLLTGHPFQDMILGLKLFLKGKLRILPSLSPVKNSIKKFWKEIKS